METITTYTLVRLRPLQGAQIEKHRILTSGWDSWSDLVSDVASIVDLENYCYFWFESIEQSRVDEGNMITFRTNVWQHSGKYFINAYIEEYEDVCVNNKELAFQMTNLDCTHIVRSVALNKDDRACWTEMFDPEKDQLINI